MSAVMASPGLFGSISRQGLYFSANAAFVLLVAIGAALSPDSGVHPLYLVLLFALCTTPIFDIVRLNDRYGLLALYSIVYFMFYGFLDLATMLTGETQPNAPSGLLSAAEVVILVGGALAQIAYRCAARLPERVTAKPPTDWREHMLVFVGLSIWAVCTWLSWEFKVKVIVDATIESTARGLASLSGMQAAGFVLAIMVQPLGILMLAYAQCVYRRAYMTPLIIAVVLVQLVLGFVVDIKGDALIAAILVVLTKLLVSGKIPKSWLIAVFTFILVAFPVLQANRAVRGAYGFDRAYAARDLGEILKKSMSMSREVSTGQQRSQKFYERLSLKGSVELIVGRTGRDVQFQEGHTLTPLLAAFIPRLVWRTKPDVQAGQVMNKEFQVSDVADTYISPSHLGELYWNFGWPGVLIGMPLIGLLLGYLGTRFELAKSVTLTRVMVAVVTIRLLILGAEGTIAVQYVVWLRSMLAIGLLHLVLARLPVTERDAGATNDTEGQRPQEPQAGQLFPNLMR